MRGTLLLVGVAGLLGCVGRATGTEASGGSTSGGSTVTSSADGSTTTTRPATGSGEASSTAGSTGGGAPVCGDGVFEPGERCPFVHQEYGVGDMGVVMALGDFDGNDALDVAVARWSSGRLSFLWGAGDGTFEEATDLNVFRQAVDLVVADMDGDSIDDLLVPDMEANQFDESGLIVYPGTPDRAMDTELVLVAGSIGGVAVANLDADPELELVLGENLCGCNLDVCSFAKSWVQVFDQVAGVYEPVGTPAEITCPHDLRLSAEGLTATESTRLDRVAIGPPALQLGTPEAIVEAPIGGHERVDLDGDGWLELITMPPCGLSDLPPYVGACDGALLQVYAGEGPLQVTPQVAFEYPLDRVTALTVGDIWPGAAPEVVAVSTEPATVSIFEVTDLGFEEPDQMPAGEYPVDVMVSDLNGDGALDILVLAGYGGVVDVYLADP